MRRRHFLNASLAFMAVPFGMAHSSEPVAISGNIFRIGAEEFQLADITAPSIYAFDNSTSAYLSDAKGQLQHHIQSRDFQFDDVSPPSRWGVRRVRSRQKQSVGVLEKILIANGAARVAPQTDDVDLIDNLLGQENVARRKRAGLWSLDAYRIFDAHDAVGAIGQYHLITGKVVSAYQAGRRFYLNFGEDFRTDFTASAVVALHRKWQAEGLDLSALEGKELRIRGYVNSINGPSIDLTHSRQIEVLSLR